MADPSFAEKLAHWRAHGLGVIRSGAAGSTRSTAVRHDRTGAQVGTQTEHWDGRMDARAEQMAVSVNPALTAKERDA